MGKVFPCTISSDTQSIRAVTINLLFSCASMEFKSVFKPPLYNLPQLSTLVAAIRQGRRIEACERDYKILPCILPFGPAIKRLFNFDPIEISASQADA